MISQTRISKQTIISNLYKHHQTGSAGKNVEIQFIFHYDTLPSIPSSTKKIFSTGKFLHWIFTLCLGTVLYRRRVEVKTSIRDNTEEFERFSARVSLFLEVSFKQELHWADHNQQPPHVCHVSRHSLLISPVFHKLDSLVSMMRRPGSWQLSGASFMSSLSSCVSSEKTKCPSYSLQKKSAWRRKI